MTEQQIQKNIIKCLEDNKCYTVKVIAASKSGVPDIISCVPTIITADMVGTTIGVFAAVEVKTPSTSKNVSKLQEYNLKKITEAGGKSLVAWEVKQVKGFIDEIQ